MIATVAPDALAELARRRLNNTTHRLRTLPVVILMPHSSCNCRCVMCDIWKANADRRDLSASELAPHIADFQRWHVQRVVLSGGEALMHDNLWTLCALLREQGVKITLLSTGLLLRRHAERVVRWCDDVTVSLDGSREVHDAIRRVPNAFDRLADGVRALQEMRPGYPVRARCVVQQQNFRDLPNIIATAHDLTLTQLSFLAADVTSTAFNRPAPWTSERTGDVALSADELPVLSAVIERVIRDSAADIASGFIAESPAKLRRLVRHWAAVLGLELYPPVHCNAPWVSTVVEADGTVRPCFFHRSLGNLHDASLDQVLNSPAAIQFRQSLDVSKDPTCRACTCSLWVGGRTAV